ncbi:MAG: MarC family protein, partial [Phycisphaerales bacterium]|nr:MarC family protein [Phycisphaerales bacterium]
CDQFSPTIGRVHHSMIDFLATFIAFFAVIDPIGTVPVFVAVTQHCDEAKKRRLAFIATGVSAAVLVFFVLAGEIILRAMSIPLPAFRIAGGLVLFLFAITMILGESKPETELTLAENAHDTAIYPLAVPSIAGPGAMLAAVLFTENSRFNLWEQAQTVLMMLAVLVVALVLMLVAGRVQRVIGASGASVVSRVMGLIIAPSATHNALKGIKEYFEI